MRLLRNTVMSFFGITLTIGIILIALNYSLGQQTTFIEKVKVDNVAIWYYKFNLAAYTQNLQTQANSLDFSTIMPQLPGVPELDFGDAITLGMTLLAKGLFLVINWLIYILSWILLVPFKILAYIQLLICAVLGINTGSYNTLITEIYNFNVPYLDYNWVTLTT